MVKVYTIYFPKYRAWYTVNMNDLIFSTTTEDLSPNDKKIMVDGMLAYHASKGHPRKVDQYSVLIKNKQDKLIGVGNSLTYYRKSLI